MMFPAVVVSVLLSTSLSTNAQDVLGCGGFIRSKGNIDFSRINVELYTKQGSLKYKTDCAPNNGYYFIPIDEKGEYKLKVLIQFIRRETKLSI